MVLDTKAIRLPRVRESCKPCRQRKTRCNADVPCQSCILRGTELDCELQHPSSGGAGGHSGGSAGGARDSSPSHHPGTSSTNQAARMASSAGGGDAHRLKATIARLQADLDQISRREHEEAHRALWSTLVDILPPRRACETLLEYVIQECDWQWYVGNLESLWKSAVSSQAVSPGRAITLCISLALPIFVLRHQPSPLYPLPPLSAATETALFRLAQSLVAETVQDLDDINATCDFCTYLIYTQAINHLPMYISRCEALAVDRGYLDESHPSWDGLSAEEREWRRQVAFQLIQFSGWQQMYTGRDPFAEVRLNICRPNLRPVALRSPLELDLPLDGGVHWADRSTYRLPDPLTNAAELRMLRIKSSAELERTARFQQHLSEALDIVPSITRVQHMTSTEAQAEQAHGVYLQLLHIRDVRKAECGLSDDLLPNLDLNEDTQRRLALQVLVARSGMGHIIGYLLRPWLLSASAASLSPGSGYPSLHARLATAALDNAEYCMKSIPLVQAMLPYPQANMVGAFISANLFNAATAFAVPVLRTVQAWKSTGEPDSDADIRALPAWPASFYPFHNKGDTVLPTDDSRPPSRDGHGRANGHNNGNGNGNGNGRGALDGNVRMYANWILLILDTLTLLKSNYLGKEAEARLRALVDAHHIRDGTLAAFNSNSDPVLQLHEHGHGGATGVGVGAGVGAGSVSHPHPPMDFNPPMFPGPEYDPPTSSSSSQHQHQHQHQQHLPPLAEGHSGMEAMSLASASVSAGAGGVVPTQGILGGAGLVPFGSGGPINGGAENATGPPGSASASTGVQSAQGVQSGQGGQGGQGGSTSASGSSVMGMDLRWLDELLSMDQSVWDGLLKDGSREIGM